MKKVYSDRNIKLYEYKPSLIKPLFINFEKMSIVRRVRFLKEYCAPGHYRVYYLSINNELVGHCVVTPGGRRLKCSSDKDIVIGPYFIKKSERRKGYSERIIRLTLQYCSYDYNYAFDWIHKNNIASIKATERCGFTKIGELNVSKKIRRLIETNNGENNIYRISNSDIRFRRSE